MKKIYISRRDSIILSAVEIIDELGIHALSIRELAKRQGVTEPAIYRHFKSKKDLVLAILDYYSNYDRLIETTIQGRDYTAKEAIIFIMKSYSEYYEADPAITGITLSYDVLQFDDVIGEKIKQILNIRYNMLFRVIEEGKHKGELNGPFNCEDLTRIIIGTTMFIVHRWRLEEYRFSFKKELLQTIESLLKMC